MTAWAALSQCERYRYQLGRTWGDDTAPHLPFVMLNPSTADAAQDDPTIRRCIGFAKDLGYSGLIVVNLYAWRATQPADLWKTDDPVGPGNDSWLFETFQRDRLVIAAWGGNARPERVELVTRMARACGARLHALGVTKDGQPRHPLYLPKSARPEPWAA